jgi:branched-chain amino acid aminotransferase
MFIYLNGRLVEDRDACVSVYDHGFLYGDGIYETMRAYDGKVFMLDRHIERLERSASLVRLKLPDTAVIRDAVYGVINANDLRSAYVRVTVSRGKGPVGLDPALCPEPTVVVIAENFAGYPEKYFSEGVRLIIAATRRNSVAALDPKIKSLNFLNNILAKIEAKDRNAYEAIMLNLEGFIAEGTVSNIFFVKDGALCTPALEVGVLDGITRELVVSVAEKDGIRIKEGRFLPEDIYSASEVFFTNTTSEIMPVSSVDEASFPVGMLTGRLRMLYRDEVNRLIRESV